MTDILNQFKTLENSISISTFSYKKRILFSLIISLLIFPLFKPLYMYKKEIVKEKVERGGKIGTVYKEKYKISIKKIAILYILYSIIVYLMLRFVFKM